MSGGRPLRFLALTFGGWFLFRVMMLSPSGIPPLAAPHPESRRIAAILQPAIPVPPPAAIDAHPSIANVDGRMTSRPLPTVVVAAKNVLPEPAMVETSPRDGMSPRGDLPPPLRPPPLPLRHSPLRLTGSAWLLARGGSNGTLSGGQLGGSQAGVRIAYAIGEARRLALTARLSAPISGRGKEAALGVEWKPTRLPIRIIAEQRFVLDDGRGGPTIGAIGGFGPRPIAAGFDLETYGQAGAIARDGIEGFVDVASRITRPVVKVGGMRFDLGAGAWGSAQRSAARFDVGPSVGIVVPIDRRTIRLNLDWRQRVAGNARPGSGPALSIGSDF